MMKRYWTMQNAVELDNGIIRHLRPLDMHKPRLNCTVSDITEWILDTYPGMEIASPADNGTVLLDAVRALDMYGKLEIRMRDAAGNKFLLLIMEI